MPSNMWSLGLQDWLRGLIATVIGAVLGVIISFASTCLGLLQQSQQCGGIAWQLVLMTAIVSGGTYIVQHLGTDHNGNFLGNKHL